MAQGCAGGDADEGRDAVIRNKWIDYAVWLGLTGVVSMASVGCGAVFGGASIEHSRLLFTITWALFAVFGAIDNWLLSKDTY